MHGIYKRQLHEWAQTVEFEKVLKDCCEPCMEGIMCIYCEGEKDVYSVYWKGANDYYCLDCLRGFLNNELPSTTSYGSLRNRFLVFNRDGFKCVYCGRNPRDHDTVLEVEHVLPKAKGGSDVIRNLVTACKECNQGKGDYLLDKRTREKILKGRE